MYTATTRRYRTHTPGRASWVPREHAQTIRARHSTCCDALTTLTPPRALRSFIAFGAQPPTASPAAQLAADSEAPQPSAIGDTIVVRLMKERTGEHVDGPLAPPCTAAAADAPAERPPATAADGDVKMADAEPERDGSLLSLESVISALEAAGVRVDRTSLPGKRVLQQLIDLPHGGHVGSSQRARLRDAGVAMMQGIAATVNPDGPGTCALIGEALVPPPPLEDRQRLAADVATDTGTAANQEVDPQQQQMVVGEAPEEIQAMEGDETHPEDGELMRADGDEAAVGEHPMDEEDEEVEEEEEEVVEEDENGDEQDEDEDGGDLRDDEDGVTDHDDDDSDSDDEDDGDEEEVQRRAGAASELSSDSEDE